MARTKDDHGPMFDTYDQQRQSQALLLAEASERLTWHSGHRARRYEEASRRRAAEKLAAAAQSLEAGVVLAVKE
jgi:hypothetical protein